MNGFQCITHVSSGFGLAPIDRNPFWPCLTIAQHFLSNILPYSKMYARLFSDQIVDEIDFRSDPFYVNYIDIVKLIGNLSYTLQALKSILEVNHGEVAKLTQT